jgi:hypothetical protein
MIKDDITFYFGNELCRDFWKLSNQIVRRDQKIQASYIGTFGIRRPLVFFDTCIRNQIK